MLKIRPYRDDDFTALGAIFLRAVQETASHDYSPRQIAAWAQIDEARWRHKMRDSRVLVAVIDPLPVGFISAVDRYIDLLFVAPEYGRRGIASALLQELFAQMPHGSLTVDASITAKPFFARHGFRGEEEQQVAVRGETFINYRMEKMRRPG
ncbi:MULTISPECIES: GNAT family N-acetyltransferase [Raoultella]|uniref:GNAT family N-acetyltransferase n=1 Tax=Raoultella planticola TaxID=575 RepID=A0AAN5L379_RAOPL|nr:MULTISPECIES: GNAT family N-acetyltransferase [Raoultella]EJR0224158.1 GNAT family N-acetyltransferase [Raoultella planticola]EJR0225662.1 GNAT family N-acetyltransferase [Raoultella planticola]EJR0353781.1 GNAT family N-acetyltransferase [Raoultella planticola]EJR0355715.1 GNAT family N-acetyltransferase [Raoultella planticola]MDV1192035.1 GNAT family N-acetyltransferase [Raoultella planticola]